MNAIAGQGYIREEPGGSQPPRVMITLRQDKDGTTMLSMAVQISTGENHILFQKPLLNFNQQTLN